MTVRFRVEDCYVTGHVVKEGEIINFDAEGTIVVRENITNKLYECFWKGDKWLHVTTTFDR